jgi:16S rRNA (cytosine1402-N4)-methyltransferase
MHLPVLAVEVVEWMGIRAGGTYIDGTLGGGGHARLILERTGPQGRLLALDRDDEAIARAREALGERATQCRFVQGSFADVETHAAGEGIRAVDGVLLDVGMSSNQVDDPQRGFSFLRDGPLDMRFDRRQACTAEALVNRLTEPELARILWDYGEEPAARRIARRLAQERAREPIRTTGRLAEVVAAAKGGVRGRIHPATQTFQALRVAVNGELDALERGLEGALRLLRPGGRLAVIAFHSLEDRCVKHRLLAHAGRWESLAEGGRRWQGEEPPVRILTRKPVRPGADEEAANPRARSARLRVAERTA